MQIEAQFKGASLDLSKEGIKIGQNEDQKPDDLAKEIKKKEEAYA